MDKLKYDRIFTNGNRVTQYLEKAIQRYTLAVEQGDA